MRPQLEHLLQQRSRANAGHGIRVVSPLHQPDVSSRSYPPKSWSSCTIGIENRILNDSLEWTSRTPFSVTMATASGEQAAGRCAKDMYVRVEKVRRISTKFDGLEDGCVETSVRSRRGEGRCRPRLSSAALVGEVRQVHYCRVTCA